MMVLRLVSKDVLEESREEIRVGGVGLAAYFGGSEGEKLLLKRLYHVVKTVEAVAPRETSFIPEVYRYIFVKRDIMNLISKLINREKLESQELIYYGVDPLITDLYRELEISPTIQRLTEITRGTPLSQAFNEATQLYSTFHNPSLYEWILDRELLTVLLKGVKNIDRDSQVACGRILCMRRDEYLFSTAVHGLLANVPLDILRELVSPEYACKIPEEVATRLIEVGDAGQAAALIRQTPYSEVSAEEPMKTLTAFKSFIRRKIREISWNMFNGMPFHAGLMMAVLELARLESEDLSMILTGKVLGVSRDYLYSSISVI